MNQWIYNLNTALEKKLGREKGLNYFKDKPGELSDVLSEDPYIKFLWDLTLKRDKEIKKQKKEVMEKLAMWEGELWDEELEEDEDD